MVCGVPSLLSVMCLMFLPETPKYLMSRHRYLNAKSVFQRIFVINTGKDPEEYPVVILEGEHENNNNSLLLEETAPTVPWKKQVKEKLEKGLTLVKKLFTQPYVRYLAITSFADFGLMAR